MSKKIVAVSNYVVIDLETTGFSPKVDKIVELGAVFVENDEIVDSIDILVDPQCELPSRIVNLTGLCEKDLSNASTIEQALPGFIDRINGKTVIGHNITFDKGFLLSNCGRLGLDLDCSYIDTMTIARKLLPSLYHHTLDDVCAALRVKNERSHRAVTDCMATHECYQRLKLINEHPDQFEIASPAVRRESKKGRYKNTNYSAETIALQTLQGLLIGVTCDGVLTEDEVMALKEWIDENRHLCGNYPFDKAERAIELALEDGILEPRELAEMLEIFKDLTDPKLYSDEQRETIDFNGKTICLTGDFETGSRGEVTELLESLGASVKSSVSGKTDFLIVGGRGSDAWKHGTYGGKIKKALELQDQGKAIKILSEDNLVEMLGVTNG